MGHRLGGWLKMGMVGTTPARGRVLLVGDAAGLVNPLQGEGISQAMRSGRAAAEAVLAGPDAAAARYRAYLASAVRPLPVGRRCDARRGAAAPRGRRPRSAGSVTAPGRRDGCIAGGWSIFWNDLLDGAAPRPRRSLASSAARVGRAAARPTRTGRWFTDEVAPLTETTV